MKEFKPRDKLTQRMTRDGAVLDNQTTGEEIHISERDAEKQLSPDGQSVHMGKRDAPMNPAEDAPKHGRQLRPQEQKEPEKEQPKPCLLYTSCRQCPYSGIGADRSRKNGEAENHRP